MTPLVQRRRWGRRACVVVVGGILGLVVNVGSAVAAEYGVSTGGSNANAGSVSTPWRTLGYALGRLRAGDTLVVAAGTYSESNTLSGIQGTASAPITIRGEPGAVVRASGSQDAFLLMGGSCYVLFENLEITGAARAGILSSIGAHHITIRNCHIHDNAKWQIQTTGANYITVEGCHLHGATMQHGIYFSSSSYVTARRNVIHDNVVAGIHMNGGYGYGEGGDGIVHSPVIDGNIIYNCGTRGAAAINMDGVDDGLIINNLLYNNKAGGITNFKIDGLHCGRRNLICNNTVYFPAGDGRYALQLGAGSAGNIVKNNILICGSVALEVADGDFSGGNGFDHNLYYRQNVWGAPPIACGGTLYSLSDWQKLSKQDGGSAMMMPSFVSVANQDFHLMPGTVGVDHGLDLPQVGTDLDGAARPQGAITDIGAYERAAPAPTTTRPPTTTSTTSTTTTTVTTTSTTTTIAPTTTTASVTTTTLPSTGYIVDNTDAAATKKFERLSGSWSTIALSGWGSNYAYTSSATTETARSRFSLTTLPAGRYEVFAYWRAYSDRSRSVPYDIKDNTSLLATVRVDQTQNNFTWVSLGTYSFSAGGHRVEVSNGGTSGTGSLYVLADAVKFVPVSAPAGPVSAIVDDSDTSATRKFTVLSGSWQSLRPPTTWAGSVYGPTLAYTAPSAGAETARARWSCTDLPAGRYQVWAIWHAYTDRSTAVPYDIKDGATLLGTVRVNQALYDCTWVLLGTYSFNAGGHVVELSNAQTQSTPSAQYVTGDAVKFVQVP